MKEINKIMNAISRVTGVSRYDIMTGRMRYDSIYRDMTCHIFVEYYSHLARRFANINRWELFKVYMRAKRFRTKKGIDREAFDKIIAKVRHIVDCAPQEEPPKVKKYVGMTYNPSPKSFAKTLFGFEYTDRDDYFRKKAIYESSRFMHEYCRF